ISRFFQPCFWRWDMMNSGSGNGTGQAYLISLQIDIGSLSSQIASICSKLLSGFKWIEQNVDVSANSVTSAAFTGLGSPPACVWQCCDLCATLGSNRPHRANGLCQRLLRQLISGHTIGP